MAFPTVVGVGTPASGTSSVSPGLPSGWAADDLHLLTVNNKRAETLSTPTGFTLVDNAVPTADNKVTAFERNAVGGDGAPLVPDPGDHLYAVIMGLRNPSGGTLVIEAVAKSVVSVASTSVTWPSVTTLGPDRLIVHLMADGRDAVGARFSGEANANLANLTERFDNGVTSNDGGGLIIVTGEMASAGATGTTTGTLSVAATQALLTIAIVAPTGGAGGQNITAALVTNSQTFSGAVISPGAAAISGGLVTNAQAFYGATVSASYSIVGGLYTDPDTFYAATISLAGSSQNITGALFINSTEFFAASFVQPVIPVEIEYGGGGGNHDEEYHRRQIEERQAIRRSVERAYRALNPEPDANAGQGIAPAPAPIPAIINAVRDDLAVQGIVAGLAHVLLAIEQLQADLVAQDIELHRKQEEEAILALLLAA